MKAVILAGGFGTRLCEETTLKPKPLVEIGGMPILWHIMKIYSKHGINEFIICCGYKGHLIKEYFSNYFLRNTDITFDIVNNDMHVHRKRTEPWKVTLVDTGRETLTGGRLLRVKEYLQDEEYFFCTYGDGVGNIDITASLAFHKKEQTLATLTAVYPPGRFGALELDHNKVAKFREKPRGDGSLINGGFFILSPKVLDRIDGDKSIWEDKPLTSLASDGELSAYIHSDFWHPMDTLRDKNYLEGLWESGNAPWKIW